MDRKSASSDEADEDLKLYVDLDQYDLDDDMGELISFDVGVASKSPPRRSGGAPPSAAARRNEDSVLFSMVGQNIMRQHLSTSPYKIEDEVADAMSDIHALTSSTPPPPVKPPPVDSEWWSGPLLPSVAPLSNGRRWGLVGAGLAVAVSVAVGAIFLLESNADDESEALAARQILELQNRYDQLVTLLAESTPEPVYQLRKELEETRRELALVRAARNDRDATEDDSSIDADPSLEGGRGAESKSGLACAKAGGPDGTRPCHQSRRGGRPSRNAPPPDPKPAPVKVQAIDDLDALLGIRAKASSEKSPVASSPMKRAPSKKETADGKEGPLTRADVQSGMRRVADQVKRCGQGEGAIVMAVTIARNGRVSKAFATGALAGSKIGRCATDAVRSARFPQSSRDVTVKYTFTL